MIRQIVSFSITIFIAFLLVCCDGSGNEKKVKQETDNPAVEPPGDNPAPDIQLQSLSVSAGNLNPEFNPALFNYEVILTPEVSGLTITAPPSKGCSVQVNDTLLLPEKYSTFVPVIDPVTDLSIFVSDKESDGVIYSLKITRMEERDIENSSFEIIDSQNYPSGWTLTGAGEFKSSNDFFRSGISSGSFTTLTSTISGREILSAPVEIDQGKNLNVSAWCFIPYLEGISQERIKISLKLYYFTDAECARPASTEYATMPKIFLKEQGLWEKIIYERISDDIPADALFVRIALRANFDSTKEGTRNDRVYFDDISLQQ